MDELLAQFLIEGRDLVAQAQADLELLAEDGANAAVIDSAFRAVHTLKGSVAIFDMAPAERVLHAAEDLLDRARKSDAPLPFDALAMLVACIDQTDRWIDQIERDGALSADAALVADRLLAPAAGVAPTAAPAETAPAPWLDTLLARERSAVAGAAGPLVAFRYTPDRDCFFRGDDPLAIAGAVPELVALTILPTADWPAIEDWEPFHCVARLEGLSAAPIEAVRAAFRLVPDQVALSAVASASPAAPESEATPGQARTLRIDAARVDRLADDVGALIVATNALGHVADRADAVDPALAAGIRAAQAEIERVAGGLHRSVSAMRAVPLAPMLRRLPRLVREIAASAGKPVRFDLSGETLEVDKQIVDGLFEPLLHLVRNAIDHGIESAADRIAAGKPTEGHLTLSARREGGDAVLALADDGAGIDPDRIRAVAVQRGLVSAEAASALGDQAVLALIFAPGFSTAAQVSDLSGRGVGMNAVQTAIDRLRGRIEIDTGLGTGTTFRLRLPLDAITTRLLVVQAGLDRYGVRMDQVVETARVAADRLVPLGQGVACVLRDRTLPVLSLAALVGGEDRATDPVRLLVARSGAEHVALRIDGFGRRIDATVRETRGLLAGVPGVAGTTILGDGEVLLVLDLPELIA